MNSSASPPLLAPLKQYKRLKTVNKQGKKLKQVFGQALIIKTRATVFNKPLGAPPIILSSYQPILRQA
jgi:hypothetical protein